MLRGGISTKVFALMLAIFIVFITGALYLQTAFFENFYTTRKAEALDQKMEGFGALYSESDWSSRELRFNTSAFERANGVRLAIVDESINMLNDEKYSLTIEDYSGVSISLDLNAALSDKEFSLIKDVQAGAVIHAEGYLLGDKDSLHMSPVRLVIGDDIIIDYKPIYGYDGSNDNLDRIAGKLYDVNLPNEEAIIKGVESHGVWSIVDYWNRNYNVDQTSQQKSQSDEITPSVEKQAFVFSEPISRDRYLARVYPLKKEDKVHYAFVVASQLPILEAVETLSSYYAIVVLAAIIMSIFLSYFVSRIVTRPLLRINSIASQMADLDFSNYIEVRTDDEIGHLSQSLNTLSMNLQGNMEELKLTNSQLQKEIEKERRLELMRREFVSGASHELKTPIGIIKGFAEGIKDGLAAEKIDYFVDVILEETDKMDALVKDMLDLSKIEQDPNTLNMESYECNAFVRSVSEKVEPLILERGLSLKMHIESRPIMVYADRRRMEQVLTNALSNAMRYSHPDTCIELYVTTHKDSARVTVNNFGKSIPEEMLEHVWDRFYRVDPSRNKESGGSGLGLSIVREILVQHEVDFGMKNIEDGVSFYFEMKKDISS